MPKRGGGNGGQRYNNNNNNNGNAGGSGGGGGGSGGSRYSTLKDFDDGDDHLRRKDHKRRVRFKPGHFVKNDIKLRAPDVRRWDDDDDMSEFATVKDRPNSRRRGSPIPRGKFGKLIANPYGWYQITINNGQIYEKEVLLRALLAAMSPHVFEPQHWRVEKHCCVFFTDDFELAERIQQLGRNAQLPDGFRLMPRVRSGTPLVVLDQAVKERMKAVMSRRYNAQTKALDLSRFHNDAELKSTFCPLFRPNVLHAVLDIICENIPDLEAINLNENNMQSMDAFKGVEKRLPHLKILYLGSNKLPSLSLLLVFRNLNIVELELRNNPFRSRFKDNQQFVSEVRRKFPKLLKLDGENLAPRINFDSESGAMPPTKASFLCEDAGADVVRQFLDQYFSIFDSGNRQPLLDAYHEQAMLSISMPSASQAGRLESFWKYNRNLRRIVSNDREDVRSRLLKSGRLACVSMLDEWPRTQHERRTFTVDLTIYNPQMIVFMVTGLFKEFTGESSASTAPSTSAAAAGQPYELRHFVRQFVVVPQNNGFCIRNETIFITSATNEQSREFKRAQHAPPPALLNSAVTGVAAATATPSGLSASLQSRLQQGPVTVTATNVGGGGGLLPAPGMGFPTGQPAAAAVTATSPIAAAAAGPPNEVTKLQMVQTLSAQSQMNLEWSRKCLEETNWDFQHAAFAFEKLFKESKIPPEAFIN